MTAAMPTIDDMKSQLLAAGWRQRSATVWRSPTGHLYRGNYGAWRAMMAGQKEVENSSCMKLTCELI